jgi:hypothetical protein
VFTPTPAPPTRDRAYLYLRLADPRHGWRPDKPDPHRSAPTDDRSEIDVKWVLIVWAAGSTISIAALILSRWIG